MKRISLLTVIVTLLLSATAGAQENNSRFSVDVSFGLSFSIGKFASKETSNYDREKSSGSAEGWANTGIGLNISGDYRLNKSIQLKLLLGGQKNKQDETTCKKVIRNTISGYDSYVVNTESWKIGKIMIGSALTIPLSVSKRIFFQLNALAGMCKTALPGHKYDLFDFDVPGFENPFLAGDGEVGKAPLPWTFCYQAGVGLKYMLTGKVFITAMVDYFNARPVHKYSFRDHYDSGPTGNIIHIEKKYPLSSINPTLGIGLVF